MARAKGTVTVKRGGKNFKTGTSNKRGLTGGGRAQKKALGSVTRSAARAGTAVNIAQARKAFERAEAKGGKKAVAKLKKKGLTGKKARALGGGGE